MFVHKMDMGGISIIRNCEKERIARMDFKVLQEAVCVNREMFSGSAEQPIDLDITLPDYCPDISRILKCQIIPQISQRQIIGDRLNVEGSSLIRLLYVDESGCGVRNCELTSPFSVDFTLKTSIESPVICTKTHVDFLNCRAVTKRRVDIHGAFTLTAKVTGQSKEHMISGAEGGGLQTKVKTTEISSLVGCAQQNFSVNETLELAQNKPQPEALIRAQGAAVLTEYKAIANKLIAKGELQLKLLYLTNIEDGSMDTMEYSIPISQILDMDGLDDDCICCARFELLSLECQIEAGSVEEPAAFEVECRLCAHACAYRTSEMHMVTDAYSTDFEIETESRQISFQKLTDFIREPFVCKGPVSIPSEGITNIIDIWSDGCSYNTSMKDGQMVCDGRVSICMLVLNTENIPEYLERTLDFTYSKEYPQKGTEYSCSPEITPLAVSYRLSGVDGVEVKAEMDVNAPVYEVTSTPVLVSVEPDENKKKDKSKRASLIIYYAGDGEKIWDIARKYNTSVEAIQKENDMAGEEMEGRGMLLIPSCS